MSITNPSIDIIPPPTRGKPYLQSSRLTVAEKSLNVSKSLVIKVCNYLRELNIPENPVPTRTVCDLVDNVRKNAFLLMSLHSSVNAKEKELGDFLRSKDVPQISASYILTNNNPYVVTSDRPVEDTSITNKKRKLTNAKLTDNSQTSSKLVITGSSSITADSYNNSVDASDNITEMAKKKLALKKKSENKTTSLTTSYS